MNCLMRTAIAALISTGAVGCDTGGKQQKSDVKDECGVAAYTQNFVTPVASIVVVWGNDTKGNGSGFLVNREEGIFMTADHVVDAMRKYGKSSADLFFNGKMYKAVVLKVLSLDDAALMQIVCSREALRAAAVHFPDPFAIASAEIGIGDGAIIMGIHAHPQLIRESNKNSGIPDRVLPIAFQYYKITQKDVTKEKEMVFDSLMSVAVRLNEHAPSIEPENSAKYDPFEVIRDSANTYTHVKTARDHKFSFGGLSGGPVLNDRGELVGIVTKERRCSPHLLSSRIDPCEDIFFTPIHKKEVRDLLFSVR